eukprot:scaffold5247_cov158-Skeletonema_marinoi.AAC.8
MVALLFTADEEANFWGNLFPQMYDISDKTKFPSVFGSNHAGFLTTGPLNLKEDWTKPCPREWTFEERREKCISLCRKQFMGLSGSPGPKQSRKLLIPSVGCGGASPKI